MQTLGYIVSKQQVKNVMGFVKVVKNFHEVEHLDIPILVVGFKTARTINPTCSILDKKLNEDVFWTFSKTENRADYETDLINFQKQVIYNKIQNIKYYYVNILSIKYNKFKRLYNIILNNQYKKYIYIYNNIIYIYYNNNIIGLSLTITDYLNINRDKIIHKLYKCNNNIISFDDSILSIHFKCIDKNNKFIMPYLMFLMDN